MPFFFFLGYGYSITSITIFSSPLPIPLTLFLSSLMHFYFIFFTFFLSLGQFSWDGYTGPLSSSVDIGIPTSHVMSVFCSVMFSRRDDCLSGLPGL